MRHKSLSPQAVALWRYQQIEPALAIGTRNERGQELLAISQVDVVWPSGKTTRVSLATLYRWMSRYRKDGLSGLRPRARKDKGKPRVKIPKLVTGKALRLLADDPEISLTFLIAVLRADPEIGPDIKLSPSTLQRRLAADPAYARLCRARRHQRRRGRYVARRPHDIWHLDAKGPVVIRFASGESTSFHVLTVLDDASRALLAQIVAPSPDLCAAVRVFRLAAKRWGLADRIYADRASIFDTVAFRTGLAELGCHRIRVRARNPEANGKIEAYHRCLGAWFTKRLKSQTVVDLLHLEQLLHGVMQVVYQDHRHRSLQKTPRQALADQTSPRKVSAQRLDEAFRQERTLKSHPKTGEVVIGPHTYLVPDLLRGQRLTFLIDPENSIAPCVVEPHSQKRLPLERAQVRAEDCSNDPEPRRWGRGPLQALYDSWQGKVRPVAEAGFGLPEIFELLAHVAGRVVPRSDAEAALIQRTYRALGPLPKKATTTALAAIGKDVGQGRPLQTYLDALKERIHAATPHHKRTRHP